MFIKFIVILLLFLMESLQSHSIGISRYIYEIRNLRARVFYKVAREISY